CPFDGHVAAATELGGALPEDLLGENRQLGQITDAADVGRPHTAIVHHSPVTRTALVRVGDKSSQLPVAQRLDARAGPAFDALDEAQRRHEARARRLRTCFPVKAIESAAKAHPRAGGVSSDTVADDNAIGGGIHDGAPAAGGAYVGYASPAAGGDYRWRL